MDRKMRSNHGFCQKRIVQESVDGKYYEPTDQK